MNKRQCIRVHGDAVARFVADKIEAKYGEAVLTSWVDGDKKAVERDVIDSWVKEFFYQ